MCLSFESKRKLRVLSQVGESPVAQDASLFNQIVSLSLRKARTINYVLQDIITNN
jgi:hypothetical protein